MKKQTILLLFYLLTANYINAQVIKEISTTVKTVPSGKKWVMRVNQEYLTELNNSSFRDGNLCNAKLRSDPRILGTIVEGNFGHPNKIYTIILKDLIQAPFSGTSTYKIIASGFLDNEKKTLNQIIFYPGQKVYLALCMNFIQINEVELTNEEKRRYALIEEEEKNKHKQEIENRIERERQIEEIRSKNYNLKEFSSDKYETFIKNQRLRIYRYFQNSDKNKYPLHFPDFEDLELEDKNYASFKGEYSIKYRMPTYIDPTRSNEDFVTESTCLEGCENFKDFIRRIAVPPIVYTIDKIPIPMEISIENLKIHLTRGIAYAKVKNGKVKFLNEISDDFARNQLKTVLKIESNGNHKIMYEFGEILGLKINNMFGEPK